MAGGLGLPWRPAGGHYRYVCKHGVLVSQCRCPGGAEKIVDCPESCLGDDDG